MPGDDVCRRVLAETREEVDRADSKASIVLASAGVAVGAVLAGLIAKDVSLGGAPGPVQLLAGVGGLLVAVGILLLGAAVFPKTGKPEVGRARYFAEVALCADAAELRKALDHERLQSERDEQQLLVVARLVVRKYRLTQWGMTALGVGLAFVGLAAVTDLVLR